MITYTHDFQYQNITDPTAATFVDTAKHEAPWHQPWSEPVRFKVLPGLAIALAASGPFAPVLNPAKQITTFYESRWHYAWSEPVRLKPGLRAQYHPFATTYFDSRPTPATFLEGHYQTWRDPVWPKKGLPTQLQQSFFAPDRLLPKANITVQMSAPEASHDSADFGVWVYTSPPVPIDLTALNVSVTEVSPESNASASIKENG